MRENRPCGACGNATPDFLLVNNDGMCNTCRDKVDKSVLEKQTLNAYEYIQIEKTLDKFTKRRPIL